MSAGNEEFKPQWRCDECNELHEYEDEAADCCPPNISKVYLCPVCAEAYAREAQARECHPGDPDAPPPPPTAQELEAAGQLRLLP